MKLERGGGVECARKGLVLAVIHPRAECDAQPASIRGVKLCTFQQRVTPSIPPPPQYSADGAQSLEPEVSGLGPGAWSLTLVVTSAQR